jgi:hypothetical protein
MNDQRNTCTRRQEHASAAPRARGSEVSAGESLLMRDDFEIRVAASGKSENTALLDRMYSSRGYRFNPKDEGAATSNRITTQACHGEQVFGTLSVCFDSNAGLAAEVLYRSEIEAYRKTGCGVCELTRLAVDPEFGSKEVLGALFHVAYFFAGPVGGASDMFIEVNPRHVSFYRRMLSFRPVGECRICPRVDAPAVLLHLEVACAAKQIAQYGGRRDAAARSLYPYFCSPEEEAQLSRHVALFREGSISGCAPSASPDTVLVPPRQHALHTVAIA